MVDDEGPGTESHNGVRGWLGISNATTLIEGLEPDVEHVLFVGLPLSTFITESVSLRKDLVISTVGCFVFTCLLKFPVEPLEYLMMFKQILHLALQSPASVKVVHIKLRFLEDIVNMPITNN